jgi:D-glycero-D-manno-heptose 1,7-bisphosphate phosphatase
MAACVEQRDIFLDRDGVINENRDDHVRSWAQFVFVPGALDALRLLTQWQYRIFIVTNQAVVGRGLITAETLDDIHTRMRATIQAHGGQITDMRACLHRPDEHCGCRKPQPGMLRDLATTWQINLARTYFVGDALTDMQAGKAAGCRTLLVRTGRGSEQATNPAWAAAQPDHAADDLLAAVHLIEAERRQQALA